MFVLTPHGKMDDFGYINDILNIARDEGIRPLLFEERYKI